MGRDGEPDQILAAARMPPSLDQVGDVSRARSDELLGAIAPANPQAADYFVIRVRHVEQQAEHPDRQLDAKVAHDIDFRALIAAVQNVREDGAKARLHLIHPAHRERRGGDAAQPAVDRRIDKVHYRNAVEEVEVLRARQSGVDAGKAPMIAQRRLHFVVTGNNRPLDTAARDRNRRCGQQRLEIGKRILMERRVG